MAWYCSNDQDESNNTVLKRGCPTEPHRFPRLLCTSNHTLFEFLTIIYRYLISVTKGLILRTYYSGINQQENKLNYITHCRTWVRRYKPLIQKTKGS